MLTHLVLHELGELARVVSQVNHVLHEVILLHRAHLLRCVVMLVKGAPRLRDTVHIDVEGLGLDVAVKMIYHVRVACRKDLISCYNY